MSEAKEDLEGKVTNLEEENELLKAQVASMEG